MSLLCLYVRGRVRMIPSEFETSLPSLQDNFRIWEVAVGSVHSKLSSQVPFSVRIVTAEFPRSFPNPGVVVEFIGGWLSSYDLSEFETSLRVCRALPSSRGCC